MTSVSDPGIFRNYDLDQRKFRIQIQAGEKQVIFFQIQHFFQLFFASWTYFSDGS